MLYVKGVGMIVEEVSGGSVSMEAMLAFLFNRYDMITY